MSGMELLLQAVERTAARSPSADGRGGQDSGSRFRGPAPVAPARPPSYSRRSLPPKKRAKLGRRDSGLGVAGSGSRAEAPAANSEWNALEDRHARSEHVGGRAGVAFVPNESGRVERPVRIGPDEWRNVLATVASATSSKKADGKANHVGQANAGRSKTKSGRRRRKRAAPLVKDVDGNDIGMGYFSMNPPRNTVSPVASPPAAEEPTAPVSPPPLNLRDINAAGLSVGAARAVPRPIEEVLCRAYLAALRRPAAYR